LTPTGLTGAEGFVPGRMICSLNNGTVDAQMLVLTSPVQPVALGFLHLASTCMIQCTDAYASVYLLGLTDG